MIFKFQRDSFQLLEKRFLVHNAGNSLIELLRTFIYISKRQKNDRFSKLNVLRKVGEKAVSPFVFIREN